MDLSFLPSLNASLNVLASIMLVRGRQLIRRGEVDAHRRHMLAAFAISSLFLLSYVTHKASRGFENTVYPGEGALRIVYLSVLFSHLSLCMAVPVMAIRLIVLGLRGDLPRHKRLARWAWPIWLYVSITGVIIYLMLYPFAPSPSPG